MSGTNASIPLQFHPTQNIGPNFGAAIENAQQLMQFQAFQKQTEQQNKLREILGAKDAIDQKTGIPTPETFSKVMSVDPITGMKLQQNSLVMQQHQLQQDVLKTKTFAQKYEMTKDVSDEAYTVYKQSIAGGLSEPAARAKAQEVQTTGIDKLRQSGLFSDQDQQNFPRQFDPVQAAGHVQNYNQWQEQQDREKRLAIDKERVDTAQKTGQWVPGSGQDNSGQLVPGMYFTPKDGGEPVFHPGVVSTKGTGGGSVAKQDQDRVVQITTDAYSKELGHTPTSPEEKTELNKRILSAEDQRAGERAATVTKSRNQITENSGVTEDPDEKKANAAQIASGQPTTQVVAGWGKEAAAARKQAHADAIRLIMDQTGMNAVDAGVELANRGIDYAGGRRAVGQESVMLAATRQSVKQLDYNIGQVKKELAGMSPDVNLGPLITGIIRQEQTWTGDPRLGPLYYSMSAVANESARLQSGGQASIAQLHTAAAKEAERWANSNMNSATFEPVAGTMLDEGKARIKSFEDAIKESRVGGQPTSGNTAPSAGGGTGGGQQHPPPTPANIRWLKKNPDKAADWDRSYPDYPSSQYLGGATAPPQAQEPTQPTSQAPSPAPQAGPRATQPTAPSAATAPSESREAGSKQMPIQFTSAIKPTDLIDGKWYATARGIARWDAKQQKFFTSEAR